MKKTLLLLAACTLVAGCGKKHDNNPINNIAQAAKDKDIQGKNFASSCQIKPLDIVLTGLFSGGQASVKSETTVYRFDGDNITRTTNLFTSLDCSGDTAVKFEESGTFTIDPDKRTADDAKYIDIDYKTLQVTTVTQEGTTAANAVHLCNATDWSVNGPARDETAQADNVDCYSAKVPRHVANVYRYDNGTLRFGAQDKASSDASNRPSRLNNSVVYTAH